MGIDGFADAVAAALVVELAVRASLANVGSALADAVAGGDGVLNTTVNAAEPDGVTLRVLVAARVAPPDAVPAAGEAEPSALVLGDLDEPLDAEPAAVELGERVGPPDAEPPPDAVPAGDSDMVALARCDVAADALALATALGRCVPDAAGDSLSVALARALTLALPVAVPGTAVALRVAPRDSADGDAVSVAGGVCVSDGSSALWTALGERGGLPEPDGDAEAEAARDGTADAVRVIFGERDADGDTDGRVELDARPDCDALLDTERECVGELDAEREDEAVAHGVGLREAAAVAVRAGEAVAAADGAAVSVRAGEAVAAADGDWDGETAALADGEQLTTLHVMRRTLWWIVSLRKIMPGVADASTPSGPCCAPPKKGSRVGPDVVKPPKSMFVPMPSALPLVRPFAPPPMSVRTLASPPTASLVGLKARTVYWSAT